jgi:hypothetical protein
MENKSGTGKMKQVLITNLIRATVGEGPQESKGSRVQGETKQAQVRATVDERPEERKGLVIQAERAQENEEKGSAGVKLKGKKGKGKKQTTGQDPEGEAKESTNEVKDLDESTPKKQMQDSQQHEANTDGHR